MTERVRVGRLVSTGSFEHLRLEVEFEVPTADGATVKGCVEHVEEWAGLVKRKLELERDLAYTQDELRRLQSPSPSDFLAPDDEYRTERVQVVTAKFETLKKELADVDGEW